MHGLCLRKDGVEFEVSRTARGEGGVMPPLELDFRVGPHGVLKRGRKVLAYLPEGARIGIEEAKSLEMYADLNNGNPLSEFKAMAVLRLCEMVKPNTAQTTAPPNTQSTPDAELSRPGA